MNSTVVDFILGHLRRLVHTARFSTVPQSSVESVAEHSYFVAVYARVLAYYAIKQGHKVNLQEILERALLHDAEEVISSDIIYPYKHYGDGGLAAEIDKINQTVIHEVFSKLPKELANSFVDIWKRAKKEDSIETEIIKVADLLSLLSHSFEQIHMGNHYFIRISKTAIRQLKKLKIEWYPTLISELEDYFVSISATDLSKKAQITEM